MSPSEQRARNRHSARLPETLIAYWRNARRTIEFRAILAVAGRLRTDIFLVGGPLRDLLLGKQPTDIDIAVESGLERFARQIHRCLGGRLVCYNQFHTATIQLADGRHIDLAQTRSETYSRPGSLPQVKPSEIVPDLARRDFTINAMAWNLRRQQLIDPFDGYRDLQAGILRVLHEKSFADDPTRIFRLIRFRHRLGFRIAPTTAQLLNAALAQNYLQCVSGERVLNELRLICAETNPVPMFKEMNQRGIFRILFGRNLPGSAFRCLRRIRQQPQLLLSRLLAYFPASDSLPLTREMLNDIAGMKRYPALRKRLLRAVRPSTVDRLLQPLSDNALRAIAACETAGLARILHNSLNYRRVQPILSGADLKRLGIAPGPIYTRILNQLRVARLDGRVTTRSDEETLVRKIAGGEE